MIAITLLIPVYNEEENLLPLSELLLNFIETRKEKWKVIFLNDGSVDGSLQKLKQICQGNSAFSYVSFDKNRGLDHVLYAGFKLVATPWTAYMDSDLQVVPSDFSKLIPFMTSYDLISGRRMQRQDSLKKRIASGIANRFRRLFTQDGAADTGCPLKLMKTYSLASLPYFRGFHRFLPALVRSSGGRTVEIPINHFPRIAGKSNFGLYDRLWEGVAGCFRFRKMRKNLRKNVNFKT